MTELPTFREFVNRYKWAKLINENDIASRASKILTALRDKKEIPDTPINNRIVKILKANITINSKAFWYKNSERVKNELFKYHYYEFVDPNTVSKKDIDDNKVLSLPKDYNKADIVTKKVIDPETKKVVPDKNNFKLSEVISDYNVSDPTVTTPEEEEKLVKNELKKARAKAAQAIVDNFEKKHNEKSVEEQIKNTVTKIAKDRELMNLSKEQLKDYLRDAYKFSDENALNIVNAVVAKRAELFANKQLKQEELTEIDISKLQEQSQRDFEKKLNDQNLRYILPAQIEKRERLVQNRLNPELLKGGY